jgi:SNF2 family DNA or RNA helicase
LCYLRETTLLAADCGTGKGVISLVAACMMVEDKIVDHVIIECEKSKLYEWTEDVKNFTDLDFATYAGTKIKREKIRQNLPTVLVGVYETFRNDLTEWELFTSKGRQKKKLVPGPLLKKLENKKVLVIQDEGPAKLGASRISQSYKTHELAFKQFKKTGFRGIGMSATPMDRDPEGYFNYARLFTNMGSLADFYENHVTGYDLYGNVVDYKNLDLLKKKFDKILLIKKKTDPDIIHLFPEMPVPDYSFVPLSDKTQDFYESILDHFLDNQEDRPLYGLMRLVAGHPQSLLRSQGDLAQEVVRLAGEGAIKSLEASKLESLVNRLEIICKRQGAQAVVFTFFGQAILPLIHERLLDEGFSVSINHGGLSQSERETSQKEFGLEKTQIFLSSDAGARGINLPSASYVEEYDSAQKHSTHIQRINRISRVNSTHKIVFAHTLVAKNTLEEGIVNMVLRRTDWDDTLHGDDGPMNGATLRKILETKRAK